MHVHFVGIGGIGMSGIAEVLLNLGYRVSGSDLKESDITQRLTQLGGVIHGGHQAEWVTGADVVVVSTAVRQDNPEIVAALDQHIPVIPRAEMLAELMRLNKFGIAVAGSHGKTSTTSMIGWLLAQAGLDPTVVIGGRVNGFGTNAKLGQGQFLVAEADESDGSFLKLSPVLEVVTNIDLEHLDYYHNIEEVQDAFLKFIEKIPFYGAVIVCLDDLRIAELLPKIGKRIITYGLTSQADFQARAITSEGFVTHFEVHGGETLLGSVTIGQPGLHNVCNALAAVAVGVELEISFPEIAEALASFSGVHRRLEVKGEKGGVTVVDDYGHHPTEVRATLAALRNVWPGRRLVVIFQPHRYSRTQGLFKEFCTAFHDADILVLTEVYSAGEVPIPGVDSEALLEGIKQHGHRHALLERDSSGLTSRVVALLRPEDVVLTLGAGNVWQFGDIILELLGDESS